MVYSWPDFGQGLTSPLTTFSMDSNSDFFCHETENFCLKPETSLHITERSMMI